MRVPEHIESTHTPVAHTRFEKLPFTGKSNFSLEDDKVDPTTVEFNNKITTEVQNVYVIWI